MAEKLGPQMVETWGHCRLGRGRGVVDAKGRGGGGAYAELD